MANQEQLIAIGDIHGCCKTARALLEKLSPYKDRRFLFIGDYIDRGPCSKEVVDFMLELKEERETIFLRGNHEQMLLDAVDKGNLNIWLHNGAGPTLQSYGLTRDNLDFPADHMKFYRSTQLCYETDNYFFVHAGLSPGQTVKESLKSADSAHDYLWSREHIRTVDTVWEKTVIFGHTPRPEPLVRKNMIGIDTGCVYASENGDRSDGTKSIGYGRLTAVLLPEKTFIHQESLDN